MTYGEHFTASVADYLATNNLNSLGKLNRTVLAELANRFHEKWQETQKQPHKAKSARAPRSSPIPDSDWLKTLSESPGYAHLSVNVEAEKCRQWCAVNNQVFSRRRLLNWLNRAPKPVKLDSSSDSAGRPKHKDPYTAPDFDWQRLVATRWPRENYPTRDPWEEMAWRDVPITIREEILK